MRRPNEVGLCTRFDDGLAAKGRSVVGGGGLDMVDEVFQSLGLNPPKIISEHNLGRATAQMNYSSSQIDTLPNRMRLSGFETI